jgi:hypothetical protein
MPVPPKLAGWFVVGRLMTGLYSYNAMSIYEHKRGSSTRSGKRGSTIASEERVRMPTQAFYSGRMPTPALKSPSKCGYSSVSAV